MIRAALVVVLVATACGTGSGDVQSPPLVTSPTTTTATTSATSSTTSADSSTTSATPLPPVTIEQVDCPSDLVSESIACGVATVPLDRSQPDRGSTAITVATMAGYDSGFVTPAAVLHGGPGAASSDLAGWFPQQPFTQVFIDQRGTGFIGADLDCPEFDGRIGEFLGLPSAEATAASLDAYTDCARRLAADPVFANASTDHHAADVADVMMVLGYGTWVAYGVSYGTTIALELLRDEPDGLVGVVLDGVYPPELDADAGVAFSAAHALEELDAACAADVACNSWNEDVEGLLNELIASLDAEPILVPLRASEIGTAEDVTVVLDGQRLAEFTFLLLYSESRIRFLPGALAGIADGDEEAAAWLARSGARDWISSQGDNDEGTQHSVQCHERLPFTDGPPPSVDPFPAANASAQLTVFCEPWDREQAPPEAAEPVTSDLPTLLLSGRFDPITPPSYAEDVAARLGSATVVEQDGRGHGIWYGDDCIAGIVTRFVDDPGRVLETSCAAIGPRIDWARP